MEAYFNGSWYPCQIVRRKAELPSEQFNLWKEKEERCNEFGEASHVVVVWLEDDPPSYSVLPSDDTRPSNKSKQAKSDENERQDIEMPQAPNAMIATINSEIEAIPSEYFRSALITCVDFTNASNLKTIAENAFNSCNSLKDVVFPRSLETVGKCALSGCTKLLLVIMNEGLLRIENGAFHECYSIENLCLSSTVEKISREAFSSCTGLERVALNASLVKMEGFAFRNCPKLEMIGVPSNAEKRKNSIPKSAKIIEPEEAFDVVFPLIQEQAAELGIEMPCHAPKKSQVELTECVQNSTPDDFAANGGGVIEAMQSIIAENKQLRAASAEREDWKAKLEEKQDRIATLTEELKKAKKSKKMLKDELGKNKGNFDKSERERKELEEDLENTRRNFDENQKEKKKLEEELEETKGDLDRSQQDLGQAKQYLDKKSKECEKMKEELDGLMEEVEEQAKAAEFNRVCRESLAGELEEIAFDFCVGQKLLEALEMEKKITAAKQKLEAKETNRLLEENKILRETLEETKRTLEETKTTYQETTARLEIECDDLHRNAAELLKQNQELAQKCFATRDLHGHTQAKLDKVTKDRDELQSKLNSVSLSESNECAPNATPRPSSPGILARITGITKRKADTPLQSYQTVQANKIPRKTYTK